MMARLRTLARYSCVGGDLRDRSSATVPGTGAGPAYKEAVLQRIWCVARNTVIDAVAAIEDASDQPGHIVCSPSSWADLSKFKQADDSNVSLVGAGTTARSRK